MLIWPILLSVWRLHKGCRTYSLSQLKSRGGATEQLCIYFLCLHMCKAGEQSEENLIQIIKKKMTELVLHLPDNTINFRCCVTFVWFASESRRGNCFGCELWFDMRNGNLCLSYQGTITADAWRSLVICWDTFVDSREYNSALCPATCSQDSLQIRLFPSGGGHAVRLPVLWRIVGSYVFSWWKLCAHI